ncbi:acyl- thioesterase 2-like [Olea europaea subsp. europaea]|uniref:Acyl- thioesterase 2-like n=1 Tax=Olea europaea subsp. europaea TaxID=158383 RepID=A0A8S0TIE4_OLEEU|nr:acyl- thioesterase 2-like [Olea europaea subsp. europaea]
MYNFVISTVKLGVGGFSMGAATALYSATCHVFARYGNRNPYPVNLSSVVGLSGWLPCSRYYFVCTLKHTSFIPYQSMLLVVTRFFALSNLLYSRILRNQLKESNETSARAATLPILLCHGPGDEVVAYKHGEKSARILSSAGFQNLTFRAYDGYLYARTLITVILLS